MTRTNLYATAARWALFATLAATPLAGCKPAATSDQAAPSDAIPLASGAAPAIAAAPAASALPPAPPIAVGRLANPGDAYAFADRAYAMNNAFADAPPDYGFDYDGTEPWVWRSDSGAMRVAEPLPDGGDRYYYYQAGADYPYLVRDPEYSYGYDDGQLVVIYDRYGHPLPDAQFAARRDYASRFFARGQTLYSTSQQQQQRQAVAQASWVARRNAYATEEAGWAADQQNDADWRAYHQAHEDQYQDQWAAERARRANEGAQFAITINDTQAADRDRQIAQKAQAHATSAPPQGPSVLGLHLGGGTPQAKTPPPLAPAGPTSGSVPVAPGNPAPPAATVTPGGPDGHHDHDHGPGAPSGAAAPTVAAGTPAGPPRRELPVTGVTQKPTPPKVTTSRTAPPTTSSPFLPGAVHTGTTPPPGMVRISPPMRPMVHTPTTAPVRPAVRPTPPTTIVVRTAPPKPVVTPPAPPKHPPQDKDVPDRQ